MVEDRITDGKRVAQLLASELTGLSTGPLDRVTVEDADPDAEPSSDGTFAYDVALDGERVGAVFVHEDSARVELDAVTDGRAEDVAELPDADGLSTSRSENAVSVRVRSGAAVKRAVDLLASTVDDR